MLLDYYPTIQAHPRAEPQYWWRQPGKPRREPVRTTSETVITVHIEHSGVLVDASQLVVDPTGQGVAIGISHLDISPAGTGVVFGAASTQIGVLHRGVKRHTDISRRIVETDDATVLAIITAGA